MTETVLSSPTKEVVIGFDRPFVVIGERINPTGRKKLAVEIAAGDYSTVESDAAAQVAAGAHVLDVNAGVPDADEAQMMTDMVKLVQGLVDVPLCIDSSMVPALEAGLAAYDGKALINSVTGEQESLESVLPLAKKYGAAVVAICNDEGGISEDPDVRFDVARKIKQRAMDHGLPGSDVVVDPLVMPVGAVGSSGRSVLSLVRRVREELELNTICGASNVSFGLPDRQGLNAAFMAMLIGAGLTSAIVNPLHDPVSRKKILMAIIEKMNASATLKAFLLLLYDKGRFGFLASVNDVYKRLADDLKGVARASLVSAAKLSSETVEKIRGTLSKRTGKDVILDAGEDPDLIGGVVTRIGDLVLDGSIKTQLLNMRESLKRGESI